MNKLCNNHKKIIAMLLVFLALLSTNIPIFAGIKSDYKYFFSPDFTMLFIGDKITLTLDNNEYFKSVKWSDKNVLKVNMTKEKTIIKTCAAGIVTLTVETNHKTYKYYIVVVQKRDGHIYADYNGVVESYFRSPITKKTFNIYNQMRVTQANWERRL